MGLDIYLFEVDADNDNYVKMHEDETNKSRIALFEKFSDFVIVEDEKGVDIEATLKKYKLDQSDLWYVCAYDGYGIVLKHHKTEETARFSWDDCVYTQYKVKKLPVREVDYQRKGMSTEFYTNYLAGCWYVSEDTEIHEDDSKDFVTTQQDLELAKTFCDDGLPLKNWELSQNQFVYFSY